MKELSDYLRSHHGLLFKTLELTTCGHYLLAVTAASTQDSRSTNAASTPRGDFLVDRAMFLSLGHSFTDGGIRKQEFFDLVHPDDLDLIQRRQRRFLENGQSSEALTYRMRRADGSFRYTKDVGEFVEPDQDGRLYWLGLLHDIDEQVRSQRQVERQRDAMELILDTIPTYVWVKDQKGRILKVNRSAAKASGLERREIEGHMTADVYPNQASRYLETDQETIASSSPIYQRTETLESTTGEKRSMLIDKYPIAAESGEHILVVGTDVTEIEKSETQFRDLFSNSPVGMLLVDRDGMIRLANAEVETMFGYEDEGLAEQPLSLLIDSRDQAVHSANVRSFHSESTSRRMGDGNTFRGVRKSGESIELEVSLISLTIQSEPMTLATVVDVSERKRAEMQIQKQKTELERSNLELDRFAYVASHDLRSPLRGILHLTGWIGEDLAEGDQEAIREHLAKLRTQASRMDSLLTDLLQYARINAVESAPEVIDSRETANAMLEFLSPLKKVSLQLADGLPVLTTQRAAFEQVLRNLFSNAIMHADADSLEIHFGCRDAGRFHQFYIQDNGRGIDPKFHHRIFEMFQSLKSKDAGGGTGMGLPIVRRVIELQGGKIWIESAIDEGATFWFTWPKDAMPPEPA